MNLFADEPERIPLDETSWLEYFPGWLDPDAATNLIAGASWEQRKQWMINRHVEPRLTAAECRQDHTGTSNSTLSSPNFPLNGNLGRLLAVPPAWVCTPPTVTMSRMPSAAKYDLPNIYATCADGLRS